MVHSSSHNLKRAAQLDIWLSLHDDVSEEQNQTSDEGMLIFNFDNKLKGKKWEFPKNMHCLSTVWQMASDPSLGENNVPEFSYSNTFYCI